jgi:hypothetical protein
VTEQPVYFDDQRPAGNQFSLRGMFLFMTATSILLAVLALSIKSPVHWLGVLLVPLCCFVIIAIVELTARTSAAHGTYSYPRTPTSPPEPSFASDGENPFASRIDSALRVAIKQGQFGNIDATEDSEPHSSSADQEFV